MMRKTFLALIVTLLTGCIHQVSNVDKKQDTIKTTDWSSLITELAESEGFQVTQHEYMLTVTSSENGDLGKWAASTRATYLGHLEGIEHHTRSENGKLVMDWFPSKL